jgi:type II secretory pathway component PulK
MRGDALRSIRSCSRARTSSERGFALIAAIALAILYFALIELMLIESSRELAEARRFRARVVAATLAENGAELAAADMVTRAYTTANAEDWQGTIQGTMLRTAGNQFEIQGRGNATGVPKATARVRVYGRILGTDVRIQYTMHAP